MLRTVSDSMDARDVDGPESDSISEIFGGSDGFVSEYVMDRMPLEKGFKRHDRQWYFCGNSVVDGRYPVKRF